MSLDSQREGLKKENRHREEREFRQSEGGTKKTQNTHKKNRHREEREFRQSEGGTQKKKKKKDTETSVSSDT